MYAHAVLDFGQATRDDEAALVTAARDGNRAAFGRLYERYARMVHGILLAHVAFEDAEDIRQEVFLTAMQRIASLRDAAAFGGWLATIARNAAHDLHRRRGPQAGVQSDINQSLPARGGVSIEAMSALREIQRLPEAYRETLTLRLVEGMTGPEIAARTGLTPDSVRVNLHRGVKLLRERMESLR